MTKDSELVNPTQFAKRFNLSRTTVYHLINTGKIPHYRIGPQTVRIDLAEAAEALRAKVA